MAKEGDSAGEAFVLALAMGGMFLALTRWAGFTDAKALFCVACGLLAAYYSASSRSKRRG